MNEQTRRTLRLILITSILSVVTGMLYIPGLPWNVLGSLREGEIALWGLWATGGGIIGIVGAILARRAKQALQKVLFVAALIGMLLFLLAQVLPIAAWFLFSVDPIADGPSENAAVGGLLPMIPHLLIVLSSLLAILSIVRVLASKQSPLRLTRRQTVSALGFLVSVGLIWYGADRYIDATFVKSTYPANGAVNVPLHDTVRVEWDVDARNGMGMSVRYADDPTPIRGVTGASAGGMFFTPDTFLPGKKVSVTARAGRRSYTFSFTTVAAANDRIDLYRAVLQHYFRPPQNSVSPDVIALDTTHFSGWNDMEIQTLAKGTLAYHPEVVTGTQADGFKPAEAMPGRRIEETTDVLFLTMKEEKQSDNRYLVAVEARRGKGILQGNRAASFVIQYNAAYKDGKWVVELTSLPGWSLFSFRGSADLVP
ncbi:hypothetical protein EFBL_1292 [Effusibacillus lacus]|uniref:Uncharacterized protein n=1 Tax=Effusibacillus lacus TaxID=1348429 RepID=A0A292YIE2_9BACL|nr:hypothetical protein EFBL_1292 [Effusibacillus lacus]